MAPLLGSVCACAETLSTDSPILCEKSNNANIEPGCQWAHVVHVQVWILYFGQWVEPNLSKIQNFIQVKKCKTYITLESRGSASPIAGEAFHDHFRPPSQLKKSTLAEAENVRFLRILRENKNVSQASVNL